MESWVARISEAKGGERQTFVVVVFRGPSGGNSQGHRARCRPERERAIKGG